ncbi:MAG: hypothetical protein AB7I30_11635 [Isosphaeraceae bacterium]
MDGALPGRVEGSAVNPGPSDTIAATGPGGVVVPNTITRNTILD